MEYSHEAVIAIRLASSIRHLGYDAVASMNGDARGALCDQADLGEYGRNQMVLARNMVRASGLQVFLRCRLRQTRRTANLHDYCRAARDVPIPVHPRALPFGGRRRG